MLFKRTFDVRFFLSVGLTLIGFLMSITVFSMFYKAYFYQPYPNARTISWEVKQVNFIAVWDIMLSRNVARHAEKWGGPQWIWKNIGDFLAKSDFNFGNLESPTNGTNVYSYQKVMVFNAIPSLVHTLAEMRFLVLNLANNHALDQGESWLTTTEKFLADRRIRFVGTGHTQEQAWTPEIVEKNGIKMAFLWASYASYNDDGTKMSPRIARMQDTKNLEKAIKRAREQADYVVVSMHAGQEYTREPTALQKDFARASIDFGADMVIGAHPHWTQKIESYKGKYIFYSLGNFVFDQDFSRETMTGLALHIFLEKNTTATLTRVELHPITIENLGQPRLLSGEAKIKALADIGQTKDILQ